MDNRHDPRPSGDSQPNGQKFTFNPNARGGKTSKENRYSKTIRGKNTTNFNREYEPAEMLVNFVSGNMAKGGYTKPMTSRDVIGNF